MLTPDFSSNSQAVNPTEAGLLEGLAFASLRNVWFLIPSHTITLQFFTWNLLYSEIPQMSSKRYLNHKQE